LTLRTVSGEILPILIEVFLTLTLARRPLNIWVFVADITEFILGMDIWRAYDASIDIGRQTLRLAEEVSLWSPGVKPRPSSLVVPRSEVIIIARLERLLGAEYGLLEPSPQAHPPEGIYKARTLVQDRQDVPVRVLNATHRDQKLTRGSLLAHCEPVTLVNPPDMGEPQARDLSSKLQDITEAAGPQLSNGEFQDLEEILTEYEDIFAVDSEDHGRTNKLYYRIDTGDARPIHQPPRRLSLAKQAEVSEMLDDMQRRRVIEESDSPWSSPAVLARKKIGNSASVWTIDN
jgi:hypothetical protein